jgi:hypothetical protein
MRAVTGRLVVLAAVVGSLVAAVASASAEPQRSLPIRIGQGIGPINLGMTGAQVYRALGRPRTVVERRTIAGRPYVELEYGYGLWSVGFLGRKGQRRVVLVLTALPRHRTPQGLGVNTPMRRVVRVLRDARRRLCDDRGTWINWYVRRGNTELVFHPGGNPTEVVAVDVRTAPVLGCVT